MSGITVRRTKNNLQNTCLIQKEMTFIHHWGYFECQLLGTQRCSHIPICQNVVFNDLWSNIMQIPSTASSLEDHSSVEIKRKKKKKTKKKKPDNPCPNTPVSHQSSDGAEGGCQPETLLGKKKKNTRSRH